MKGVRPFEKQNPIQTDATHLQAQATAHVEVSLSPQESEWNLKSSNLQ
jgi:hypothetical protein